MSQKIKPSDAAIGVKKTWTTPNIESFAVAGITENDLNDVLDDGLNTSATTS